MTAASQAGSRWIGLTFKRSSLLLCVCLTVATVVLLKQMSFSRRTSFSPDPWIDQNFTAPVAPDDLHWDTLDAHVKDEQLGLLMKPSQPPYHWVITSCVRPHLTQVLTATLASAFLNGMQPATITIVWCKPYNKTDIPDVLYNLRHSKLVKVVFLPDNLHINPVKPTQLLHQVMNESRGKNNPTGVYFTALSVPIFYKRTNIPLLITEDDVQFAPNFNWRISSVIRHAEMTAGSKPYFVQLYNHVAPKPLDEIADFLRSHNFKDAEQGLVLGMETWGAQGLLYSPAMAQLVAKHFSQVAPDYPEGAQDAVVFESIVSRFKCARQLHAVGTQRCVMFRAVPSLVQHYGSASSIFMNDRGENHRFHIAADFPVRLALIDRDLYKKRQSNVR